MNKAPRWIGRVAQPLCESLRCIAHRVHLPAQGAIAAARPGWFLETRIWSGAMSNVPCHPTARRSSHSIGVGVP